MRLRELGLLEEERRQVKGTMHFRIDKDRLYELLRTVAEFLNAGIPQTGKTAKQNAGLSQSRLRELRNLVRGIVANQNAGIPQSLLLENTSGDFSIDFSGDADPPINPPEGEEEAAPPAVPATPAEVWESVKSLLKAELPVQRYGLHFGGNHCIYLSDLTETTATLTGPQMLVDSARGKFGDALEAAFLAAGHRVELHWKGTGK